MTTDSPGTFSEGTNNSLGPNRTQGCQLINFPVIINVHDNSPNIQDSILMCTKYSLLALLEFHRYQMLYMYTPLNSHSNPIRWLHLFSF